MAVHFVPITREEWEDWLDSTRLPWARDENRKGVYLLMLNKESRPTSPPAGVKGRPPKLPAGLKGTVAIHISSSIGQAEEVMGRGRAAIHMKLVSAITGYALNRKALGQSRFNRTKNWRTTVMQKGVVAMKQAYDKAATFYDALAEIADRDAYQAEVLAEIEAVPNWGDNRMLTDFHRKLEQGGILTKKQRAAIGRATGGAPAREPRSPGGARDEALYQRARALYAEARKRGDQWLMDFLANVGKLLAAGRPLSDRQMRSLETNLAKYRLASQAQVVTSARIVAARHLKRSVWTPRSVDDWELYDEPGAGAAARALTGALVRRCSCRSRHGSQLPPAVLRAADRGGALWDVDGTVTPTKPSGGKWSIADLLKIVGPVNFWPVPKSGSPYILVFSRSGQTGYGGKNPVNAPAAKLVPFSPKGTVLVTTRDTLEKFKLSLTKADDEAARRST